MQICTHGKNPRILGDIPLTLVVCVGLTLLGTLAVSLPTGLAAFRDPTPFLQICKSRPNTEDFITGYPDGGVLRFGFRIIASRHFAGQLARSGDRKNPVTETLGWPPIFLSGAVRLQLAPNRRRFSASL